MRDRLRPSHPEHKYYVGVTICERWQKFENFLEDMGERPPGMTLERQKSLGNYTPDNCIWADRVTQNNNRRSNRKVLCRGEVMNLVQAAKLLDVNFTTLWMRLSSLGFPDVDVASLHFRKYKT